VPPVGVCRIPSASSHYFERSRPIDVDITWGGEDLSTERAREGIADVASCNNGRYVLRLEIGEIHHQVVDVPARGDAGRRGECYLRRLARLRGDIACQCDNPSDG